MEKITRRTMEEAGERSWSDLPDDILSLIIARLFGRDRSCFHGVCCSWRSVTSQVPLQVRLAQPLITLPAMIQFPMHMFSGHDGSVCNFYHPVYNTTYIMELPELASAKIRFSKDGWLLLSQGKCTMFFFNPFTKERIDLPDLDGTYLFSGIAFSSPPTSSDCVIFGIEDRAYDSFSFIRRGEDTWNSCMGDSIFKFIGSHSNPVFYNGVFYCLGIEGDLGIFDPKQGDEHGWTVLATPKPCVSIRRNYLAECRGELVSVFEGHVGKWIQVFKLDHSLMAWKKLESLGDDMLFLSVTASLSATSRKMEVLGMENKIYLPRFSGNNGVFYSLVTGKFHSFGIGFTREDCYNTTQTMHCTWIEPSFKKVPCFLNLEKGVGIRCCKQKRRKANSEPQN